MKKYLAIFKTSFRQEFAYKLNFIMWRVRNIMNILVVFYLWNSVFPTEDINFFGYHRDKILTYIFTVMILRALVLSARAVDVSTEISSGSILNHLVKPINYFKYWLTRDLSSKLLNISFAAFEFGALYILLRPSFFWQTNFIYLLCFGVSVAIAILLFFAILFIVNMVPFWAPNMGWGAQFLVIVVLVEFLSGAVFPIDILPGFLQKFLNLTPFPYLIFTPIQIYLGNLNPIEIIKNLSISAVWLVILWKVMDKLWEKGLKTYEAIGR